MGKIIVYGAILSPAVRTVLLTLKALNVEYEFKVVNLMAGEHRSEEYLKKNPQHTIPTLEDDGHIICDSHAIAGYLASKYGKDDSLYPKDFYQRAIVDQRLHFDSSVLFPRLSAIVRGVAFENNPVIPPEKLASAQEAYEFLEKFLGSNSYVAGNKLTIADFSCGATASSANLIVPFDPVKYPKILAWLERLSKLPYYEEANGEGAKALAGFVLSKMGKA